MHYLCKTENIFTQYELQILTILLLVVYFYDLTKENTFIVKKNNVTYSSEFDYWFQKYVSPSIFSFHFYFKITFIPTECIWRPWIQYLMLNAERKIMSLVLSFIDEKMRQTIVYRDQLVLIQWLRLFGANHHVHL